VVEHEDHSVTMPVNSADAVAEGHGQVVEGFEQDVGQDSTFQMATRKMRKCIPILLSAIV
jgi:hypothetical protein